jgi:hypothetical protein
MPCYVRFLLIREVPMGEDPVLRQFGSRFCLEPHDRASYGDDTHGSSAGEFGRLCFEACVFLECTRTIRSCASLLYRSPDLIVEVAHPSITAKYGAAFLQAADYMVRFTVTAIIDALLRSIEYLCCHTQRATYIQYTDPLYRAHSEIGAQTVQ